MWDDLETYKKQYYIDLKIQVKGWKNNKTNNFIPLTCVFLKCVAIFKKVRYNKNVLGGVRYV